MIVHSNVSHKKKITRESYFTFKLNEKFVILVQKKAEGFKSLNSLQQFSLPSVSLSNTVIFHAHVDTILLQYLQQFRKTINNYLQNIYHLMILGITMIHTLVYVWHGTKYLLTYKNKFIYISNRRNHNNMSIIICNMNVKNISNGIMRLIIVSDMDSQTCIGMIQGHYL